jgi:hypothetical protein
VLEGTTDDGTTWIELDRITGAEPAWRQRDVNLEEKGVALDAKNLFLRWTIHNPVATTMVEAGIDDVKLSTLTQSCNPNFMKAEPPKLKDSGCSVGGNGGAAGWLLIVFVSAFALALYVQLRKS